MKKKESLIRTFLKEEKWLSHCDDITYLAAGEYNENYTIRSGSGKYVFRINHGSQLGIENQVEYEYNVLNAVYPSGATPEVFKFHPGPNGFPGGVLLMSFIEGEPFDYRKDLEKAAAVFAAIHALPGTGNFLVQTNPIASIAEESWGLITKYPDHPLQSQYTLLRQYHEEIVRLAESYAVFFSAEPICIVNTEVNSGNFIVNGNKAYLVDWEKAVLSSRYQDLGHFLVPTTTLWKSDFSCTQEDRTRFLTVYKQLLPDSPDIEEILDKTALLERTILLRAMSWCFMAYYEYTATERRLRNEYTFSKIKLYMDDLPWFLK